MDRSAYRELVAALEETARRSPDALRRRVFGLIALGYGYVFLVLAVLAALLALLVYVMATSRSAAGPIKLILALGAVTVLILRSLWVRVDPPQGTPLDLARAPKLRTRVEEIRRALRSPRPDHVLLNEEFNASVTQVPRLGILGFPSTYLVLGLPLMYGLTPREFDAVLAHEFAHLSGAHPKRGLWVWRMGRTWHQLMVQMEQARSWGSTLFDRFVRWYVPRLDAYGFVMSRADEYAADADAARVTSREAMGTALVALHARGGAFDEDLWRDIWARADREPEPPAESWSGMPAVLRAAEASPMRNVRVSRALQAPPSESDTHPTLKERLAALGVLDTGLAAEDATAKATALVQPLGTSAAEHYLGALAADRLRALEQEWRQQVRGGWRERHERAAAERRELEALEARAAAGETLDDDALWSLAALTAQVRSDAEAVPIARRLLAQAPDHPQAHYLLGRAFLAQGDAEGEAHLERAAAIDPAATPAVIRLLYARHVERGDTDAVRRMEDRWDAWEKLDREATAERDTATKQDRFAAPDLTPAERQMLARVLNRFDGFRALLVARKVTKHRQETPMLVVYAERKTFSFADRGGEVAQDMIGHVRFERGQDVLLIIGASGNAWLAKLLNGAGAVRIER